ncbi:hypothetical protein ESCO_000338 [Escovopsis weberi]|uniref:Uncharacterized protein n=1 Tax=Escovopsis weberi TaxID=150374 RepID=A0A0M8MY01_ESCWE|nr:hypothetical protein ESCO_000338 [Escovopsis weberi]
MAGDVGSLTGSFMFDYEHPIETLQYYPAPTQRKDDDDDNDNDNSIPPEFLGELAGHGASAPLQTSWYHRLGRMFNGVVAAAAVPSHLGWLFRRRAANTTTTTAAAAAASGDPSATSRLGWLFPRHAKGGTTPVSVSASASFSVSHQQVTDLLGRATVDGARHDAHALPGARLSYFWGKWEGCKQFFSAALTRGSDSEPDLLAVA